MQLRARNRLVSHGWLLALARSSGSLAFGTTKSPHSQTRDCSRRRAEGLFPHVSFGGLRNSPWRQQSEMPPSRLLSSFDRTPEERIMTDDALAIVEQAIQAVDPYSAIRNHLSVDESGEKLQVGGNFPREYDLNDFDDIVVVAFGKASSAMATAVVQQLTSSIGKQNTTIQGIVIVKDDHSTQEERDYLESKGILLREASHPVPDSRSAEAAQKVMDTISATASSRTLVICCISGGGSALFCLPQDPLTMDDLQATSQVLLSSGLSIQDMNVIRKRLEDGKGGRLAAVAYPSTVLSLVLSDVLGDPLDLIASGPTVPDTSTFADAWQLVQKNGIDDKLPRAVVRILKDGLDGKVPDSPSAEHPIFKEIKCKTVVVGNNELAVESAAAEAQRRGYNTKVIGTRVEGEAKHAATFYAAMAQHLSLQREQSSMSNSLAELPAALIAGGETIVTIPSDSTGKGGRNQELALAAALKFQQLGLRGVVLASIGTDGTDGPTDAAGAIVDGASVARLKGNAEDALLRHDAYTYLNQSEQDGHSPLVKTGATGTNVADVCVVLLK